KMLAQAISIATQKPIGQTPLLENLIDMPITALQPAAAISRQDSCKPDWSLAVPSTAKGPGTLNTAASGGGLVRQKPMKKGLRSKTRLYAVTCAALLLLAGGAVAFSLFREAFRTERPVVVEAGQQTQSFLNQPSSTPQPRPSSRPEPKKDGETKQDPER